MKDATPTVSIGFPVYNGEKYLAGALVRLLSQSYEDFELIISDNASTDRTGEICRSFAEKDKRIRYSRNATNVGLGANHNLALGLSRGKFFKWVAYDDDFPPAMLARFVDVLQKEPPCVCLVCSHCEYIDEHGSVMGLDFDGLDNSDPWPHKRLWHLLRHLHAYNSIYGLMRSDVLRKTRLHGQFPMADKVLLAELIMLGRFVEIPEPLLRIRQHPGRTFLANSSAAARRRVFTPGHVSRYPVLSIRKRVELELIRSAAIVPVRRTDKVLCTAVAAVKPQWENFRTFGGRQKRRLFQMIPASGFAPLKKEPTK